MRPTWCCPDLILMTEYSQQEARPSIFLVENSSLIAVSKELRGQVGNWQEPVDRIRMRGVKHIRPAAPGQTVRLDLPIQ